MNHSIPLQHLILLDNWLVKPAKLWVCTLLVLLDLKKKAMYFKEISFDAAFNYKANDPAVVLPNLCPNGFAIYFDNVCCKALESVSKNTNPFSRSVCCDMMSKGNCEKPEPVHTLFRIIAKDFEACGFIVSRSPKMKENFGKQQDGFKTIKLSIMKVSLKVSKCYHKHWLVDTKI